MTSKKEQFYIQRIAELEKQVAELTELVKKLTDKVAKLSKNSSNSSKPPSSDITKPPRKKKGSGSQCESASVHSETSCNGRTSSKGRYVVQCEPVF